MAKGPRTSAQTLHLLEALLTQPAEWRYGYDLSRETGLKSGTLYPILMRLAREDWLQTRWENPEIPGRPPRHSYKLTAKGLKAARERVPARGKHVRVHRRALET